MSHWLNLNPYFPNIAFSQALVAIDLDLLMSTCERMSVEDVFGETSPVQPDILALLNQLSHNLAKNVAVTSNYLMEAVQALDLTDVVVSFCNSL